MVRRADQLLKDFELDSMVPESRTRATEDRQ